jgi:hypothetical protein
MTCTPNPVPGCAPKKGKVLRMKYTKEQKLKWAKDFNAGKRIETPLGVSRVYQLFCPGQWPFADLGSWADAFASGGLSILPD